MELGASKIDWNAEPSGREKIYFIVVMLMITVAFGRLLWIPTFKNIKNEKIKIKNIKLQVKTLEEFIKINKKIEPKRMVSKEEIDLRLEKALKGETGNPYEIISDVTTQITASRNVGNIMLEKIAFSPPQAESGYVKFPVSLSVVGTFPITQGYLEKLEGLDYLFIVDNVRVESSEDHVGLIDTELRCSLFVGAAGNMFVAPPKEG